MFYLYSPNLCKKTRFSSKNWNSNLNPNKIHWPNIQMQHKFVWNIP